MRGSKRRLEDSEQASAQQAFCAGRTPCLPPTLACLLSCRSVDERTVLRRSHENPVIQQLYDDFLEKPNSHKVRRGCLSKYIMLRLF